MSTNILGTALYTTFTGGTVLTALLAGTASVYRHEAPNGAAYPLVIWEITGGGDLNETPARSKEVIVQAEGVSQTSPANADAIDAEIDTLLHRKALTVAGWQHVWTFRESDFSFTERDEVGRAYYHSGGQYRVRLNQ